MADIRNAKLTGILLAPVVCTVLLVAGVVAFLAGLGLTGSNIMDHADVDFVYALAAVTVTALTAFAAYRLAGLLRARGGWTVPAVLVPAVAFAILQLDKGFGKPAAGLAWLAGLTVVLVVAALLAHRGLIRIAWIVGVIGAVAVADVAVIVQLWPATAFDPEHGEMLDGAYAPLWLLFALVDYDFGLDPNTWSIGDSLDLRELGYPLYAVIALGYVVRSLRPGPRAAVSGGPTPD
ncbi:hypothetical protein CS0771_63770 [Catellatospora sp. IY07-71]|uniref:hypothetical protein n=1 Tax=Catellatospora sp. IY07-71 TaxID=2728827 RepID=UPI001BB4492B|nr:hypothetical protein [Catellatospora sp. IY07-71]BCJ76833.1 hypothetical protein CS0771_63770 [Catellatospora sp. IY07-71]